MPKRLLPLIPPGLAVVQVLPTPERVTIVAQPRTPTATSPECGTTSSRVHSRYERRLHDLAWQGRAVALHIRARRFRCLSSACQRLTFSEGLPGVAPAAARRTERLSGLHGCLGAALGGEPGARLAIATSPDTLLRAIRLQAGSAPLAPTPRVLGVDDYAWRRGRRYGTVLVDLERDRVVDLLPDRQSGTLAAWLQAHPGVEVTARDRAGAYAEDARQGAPGAVQVADRWHMLRNLSDAMHGLADRHGAAVRRAARRAAEEQAAQRAAPPAPPPPEPAARLPTAAKRAVTARFARRQARYEEAARLRGQGASVRRIAVVLGVERVTIRNWLARGGAATWAKPRRGSALDAHAPLLERRWAEGCRNATRLWREAAAAGYRGRPGTVRTWAAQRRVQQPAAVTSGAPVALASAAPPPSGRRVGRWLLADESKLGEAEQRFVGHMLAEAPGLAEAVAVAKRLRAVLRKAGNETLASVLDAARGTLLGSFAAGLERDRKAVQAALDLPWSTSPVEGQVNRLKTIKRAMYGRAGFDLLRARVLRAA